MKIVVLGAGALGSAIGGVLAEAGSEVWLVNRRADHVEALHRDGLRLVEDGVERTVRVHAARSADSLGRADLVIVLVKSVATAEAIAGASGTIGPDTVVMSLQNGLGHEDILAEAVGEARILAGKTYVGGVLLSPGRVRVGVRGKETIIGEPDGADTPRVRAVSAEFNRAGLATTVSRDIMATIWDKLLVNIATGALSGITGLAYGGLYDVAEIEHCAVEAVAEAMAVARAVGIDLATNDPRAAWLKAAEGLPPEFRTSMLQSLENGSRTEIDFINGAVVRHGQRHGVPTPVNRALVACIKGIEHRLGMAA